MAQKRIFFAADDKLLGVLVDPLRKAGLVVETFRSVADLVPATKIDPPDALLLGARLTDGTALAAFQSLEGRAPPTVVILAPSQLPARPGLLKAGLSDIAVSPIRPRALATRLSELAGGARRADHREFARIAVRVTQGDDVIEGHTNDVSREGLGLVLPRAPKTGLAAVVLEPEGRSALPLFGSVLHARAEGDAFHVGIRLLALAPTEETLLVELAHDAAKTPAPAPAETTLPLPAEVTPTAPPVEAAAPEVTPTAPPVEAAAPEVTPVAPLVEAAAPEVTPPVEAAGPEVTPPVEAAAPETSGEPAAPQPDAATADRSPAPQWPVEVPALVDVQVALAAAVEAARRRSPDEVGPVAEVPGALAAFANEFVRGLLSIERLAFEEAAPAGAAPVEGKDERDTKVELDETTRNLVRLGAAQRLRAAFVERAGLELLATSPSLDVQQGALDGLAGDLDAWSRSLQPALDTALTGGFVATMRELNGARGQLQRKATELQNVARKGRGELVDDDRGPLDAHLQPDGEPSLVPAAAPAASARRSSGVAVVLFLLLAVAVVGLVLWRILAPPPETPAEPPAAPVAVAPPAEVHPVEVAPTPVPAELLPVMEPVSPESAPSVEGVPAEAAAPAVVVPAEAAVPPAAPATGTPVELAPAPTPVPAPAAPAPGVAPAAAVNPS